MFRGYFLWVLGSTTSIFLERAVHAVLEERGETAPLALLRGEETGLRISAGPSWGFDSIIAEGDSVLMARSLDLKAEAWVVKSDLGRR